jgi:alpha-D-xyloside xylohydrolase
VAKSVFIRLNIINLLIPAAFAVLTARQITAQTAGAQTTGVDPHPSAMQVDKSSGGLVARNDYETIEVTICGDALVHVVGRPVGAQSTNSPRPWMLDQAQSCPGTQFQFTQSGDNVSLVTGKLQVTLSMPRAMLTFSVPGGEALIREEPRLARTYLHSDAPGRYHIQDRFSLDPTEAIYGLGQHQNGLFNYRGSTVEMVQNNTDVAIPLLLSTKGYAILWNSASFGYADNRFPLSLNLESLAGDQVDYYLIYGPEMDEIIHRYRTMTGHAPLLPQWAYGLFQSKDRYVSQTEMLDVANQYRSRHIPMDGLVQDWYWWTKGGEGDPVFNSNYTDIPAELKTLHNEHVHAMISVWGLMDDTAKNFQQIRKRGLEIDDTHVYDPTNPEGRDLFWNNLAGKLFAQGWDAFWLDSAEPEEHWPHLGDGILRNKQLNIGSGLEYTNVFPFVHNLGVQDHWKQTTQEKRVFLLTRSAFLGQQRVGATVWSGDVYQSWWALQHQVPAGLNFALSGYPYWTTDIGGYHPISPGSFNKPEYQELYARWFEYGAFCPIFRTHGHRDHNELWVYDHVFPVLLSIDKLRYRLFPYVYSLAWKVTNADYTIQRPLVMDFRKDPETWNIGDEFLFGPSILVSPVLKEHATERSVYLPSGNDWYDFWSGEKIKGGNNLNVAAPLDRIPLNVRAGSIIPLGPEIEYAGEATDPIELRVYPGKDGDFTLYEDEGDSYRYQNGAYATTEIHWDDAAQTLTFAKRQGNFNGMPAKHTFNVVIVKTGHGAGPGVSAVYDKTVSYSGEAATVKF